MPSYGYSLMCEPYDPNELLAQAVRAEAAGFDLLTISDHFHPWPVLAPPQPLRLDRAQIA
jgi:alkanesulfonate monooxygenase SsuD/methylene tetrahydromethanopterin reductase-like flavin-dependent oxidoreductase (luciferase family)